MIRAASSSGAVMGYLSDLYAARGRALADRETSVTIVTDKAAYLSPLDRTVVEGRTAHREHMKRHNVLEAGDMKIGEYGNRDNSPMTSAGKDIMRAMQELGSR